MIYIKFKLIYLNLIIYLIKNLYIFAYILFKIFINTKK
jgi:hypothetical protein